MMGGGRGEDFVFRSSDSDDADWNKYLSRYNLKKSLCNSSTSSNSTYRTEPDSLGNNSPTSPEIIVIPETPENLLPSKKRTLSDSTRSGYTLHSKRNCSQPQLLMGNGFRHERVGNNSNGGDSNQESSKSSEMSWQNKNTDRNHPILSNHASSSINQPSGSSQDSSSRQSRYHNRPARRNLILNSDSDDDNWTEKTSDNATFQSHSNSPERAVAHQRTKRLANNPPRKSKTGYLNRTGKDSSNNNTSSTAQPTTSQINKETVTSNGISHHNHRLKRNTTGASGASVASTRSSNEDDSLVQSSGQITPKNRHIQRLRMHQNRPAASGANSYTVNSDSESFPSNLPFRRDDPGRRAFARSGHPLHGRRSQGSPHHHHHRSPLQHDQDTSFQSLVRRNPDLFESESTDESELFAGVTNSLPRNSFRRTSPTHRNNFQYQTFGSPSLLGNERDNTEETEDLGVIFVPENRISPMSRNRRRDQGRFTGGSGGRRRRSSRPAHLLSGERNLLSSSPDPVAQITQMEEDERLARLLQAEFDAELPHHRHNDSGSHLYYSESDVEVLVDDEETLSSLSSSSSTAEDTSYGSRHRQRRAQHFIRHQNNLDGSSVSGAVPGDAPARGRRRGSRGPSSTTPAAASRHWHGSPVRGRRGHTRSSQNADPLMLQFGRWLGWAIIRNLDTEEDDYEVLWNLAESMGDAVPRGLQRREINRLPTHKYQPAIGVGDSAPGAASSSNNNNNNSTTTTFTEATKECRVCLCDYEINELLRVLPCFHEFHAACIDKWLKNNNTCPVCRAEISLDS